jgi:hypothetical protein
LAKSAWGMEEGDLRAAPAHDRAEPADGQSLAKAWRYVSWNSHRKMFRVQMRQNGTIVTHGIFHDLEDAISKAMEVSHLSREELAQVQDRSVGAPGSQGSQGCTGSTGSTGPKASKGSGSSQQVKILQLPGDLQMPGKTFSVLSYVYQGILPADLEDMLARAKRPHLSIRPENTSRRQK